MNLCTRGYFFFYLQQVKMEQKRAQSSPKTAAVAATAKKTKKYKHSCMTKKQIYVYMKHANECIMKKVNHHNSKIFKKAF